MSNSACFEREPKYFTRNFSTRRLHTIEMGNSLNPAYPEKEVVGRY